MSATTTNQGVVVKIVKGHQARTGETCVAKKGSMVWAALVGAAVGSRVESRGIVYEKVEATP